MSTLHSEYSPRPVRRTSGYNVGAGWTPRSLRRALALGLSAALAACTSESPTAPAAPQAQPSLVSAPPSTTVLKALTREVPLSADLTVQSVIGAEGGTFAIPEAGLKVIVPAGAVSEPTVFTATALAGTMVAYEFGPHGSRFATALKVQQELRGTSWYKATNQLLTPEVGYFAERSDLNEGLGVGVVSEVLPTDIYVELTGSKLRFDVWHFSGYMVSSGRQQ